MKKMLLIGVIMSLLLVGVVSGYYCVEEEDNEAVRDFKSDMNVLALKNDVYERGLTKEAFEIKLKYFHPCN